MVPDSQFISYVNVLCRAYEHLSGFDLLIEPEFPVKLIDIKYLE